MIICSMDGAGITGYLYAKKNELQSSPHFIHKYQSEIDHRSKYKIWQYKVYRKNRRKIPFDFMLGKDLLDRT